MKLHTQERTYYTLATLHATAADGTPVAVPSDGWDASYAGAGPGQVEVETLFNIGGYPLDHLLVRTNGQGSTTQPLTAAAYAQAWRQG